MKIPASTLRSIFCGLMVCTFFAVETYPQSDDSGLLEQLRDNVVSITVDFTDGSSQDGFGFIIADNNNSFFIATCKHLIKKKKSTANWEKIVVKFRISELDGHTADLVYVDFKYDLAILKTKRVPNLALTKRCIGSDRDLKRAKEVWFIGKQGKWHLSAYPGRISKVKYNKTVLLIEGFEIAPGTSGAPIICDEGIIGMIIDDSGTDVEGLTTVLIRDIVVREGYAWSLEQLGKNYRGGPYGSAALGVGSAKFKNPVARDIEHSRTGLTLDWRLGYVLSNSLLIGFENAVWYRRQNGLVYKYDSYAAVVTYYYTDQSYIKLGGSIAGVKAEPLAVIKRKSGFGIVGGVGMEYRLGENLTIGPAVTIINHKLDDVSAIYASLALNLTWFYKR
jgi:hypothetical protein